MKQNLDKKAVWLFFFQRGFVLVIAIPVLFAYLSMGATEELESLDYLIDKVLSWTSVVAIIVLIGVYVWARLNYIFWKYEIKEETIEIEKGIIWKKYFSIPYNKVQNVDIYRGILDRILEISDLQIQTAGYSAGTRPMEGRLPGLSIKVAEELKDKLLGEMKEQGTV